MRLLVLTSIEFRPPYELSVWRHRPTPMMIKVRAYRRGRKRLSRHFGYPPASGKTGERDFGIYNCYIAISSCSHAVPTALRIPTAAVNSIDTNRCGPGWSLFGQSVRERFIVRLGDPMGHNLETIFCLASHHSPTCQLLEYHCLDDLA
jgi:hypothetical protein